LAIGQAENKTLTLITLIALIFSGRFQPRIYAKMREFGRHLGKDLYQGFAGPEVRAEGTLAGRSNATDRGIVRKARNKNLPLLPQVGV
jgi:hypothetical protein